MTSPQINIQKALAATRETKNIEFKDRFDPTVPGEWCELIKDIVAIANSGGGVILIGANDGGEPTGEDVSLILELDSAIIVDKVSRYIGCQFAEIDMVEAGKQGYKLAVFVVASVDIPYVMSKPGTYDIGGGKQKTAFGVGTIYFRHGPKSEPGTTEDLRRAFRLQANVLRKEWNREIRKVVEAPAGSKLIVLPPTPGNLARDINVRVVNDPHVHAIPVREDNLLANFPYTARSLAEKARQRYSDFVENAAFHAIKRKYDGDAACSMVRLLNPNSPRTARTRFYSEEMLLRLDKHYNRRCVE